MAVIKISRYGRRIAAGGLVLALLPGCQMFGWFQDPPAPDPQRTVRLEAALDVNPNLYGRPSPVLVTLYQLADPQAFLEADLAQLRSKTQEPGSLWLARQTFQLSPGELRTHRFIPEPSQRYLAVVAEYRDLDNARWRAVEAFHVQSPLTRHVDVTRDAVSISAMPQSQEVAGDVE